MTREELLSRFDILRTEYIKLLNDKDVLLNWGKPQLEALYSTRIGIFQVEALQLQLQVKALKRKIEIVRSIITRNLPLDVNAIEIQVAAELSEAEKKIMQQVSDIERGRDLLANLAPPQRNAELRKVFRELAKQLHPDVNPGSSEERLKIWQLAKDAYHRGDLDELEALQIVYEKELKDSDAFIQKLSDSDLELRNETLSEGIRILNMEIEKIKNEFPFTIEAKIKDEQWVQSETEKIMEEITRLRTYEGELILEYESLINGYGGTKPELN